MYDEEPRRLINFDLCAKKMEIESEKHRFEFISAEWLTMVKFRLDE